MYFSGSGVRDGVCYTAAECSEKNGVAQGPCAIGFGVCCVFSVTDPAERVIQNVSYVQNPGYPSGITDLESLPTGRTQSYVVNKIDQSICFLRLDFEMFDINGLTATDESEQACPTDTLNIRVQGSPEVPTICGENSNQHLYLELGSDATATATLDFNLVGPGTRMWDIKVSQIECNNPSRPPKGCLQYFTGTSGQFMTFNFRASNNPGHLPNHRYSACFRREVDFCCLRFQVCSDEDNSFSLSTGDSATPVASRVDAECNLDYVGIPQSSSQCDGSPCSSGGVTRSKYCGGVLNDGSTLTENIPICVCAEPFLLNIVTDDLDDTGVAATPGNNAAVSRGVCLDWSQVPCNA